jgi:hypothetical protein
VGVLFRTSAILQVTVSDNHVGWLLSGKAKVMARIGTGTKTESVQTEVSNGDHHLDRLTWSLIRTILFPEARRPDIDASAQPMERPTRERATKAGFRSTRYG